MKADEIRSGKPEQRQKSQLDEPAPCSGSIVSQIVISPNVDPLGDPTPSQEQQQQESGDPVPWSLGDPTPPEVRMGTTGEYCLVMLDGEPFAVFLDDAEVNLNDPQDVIREATQQKESFEDCQKNGPNWREGERQIGFFESLFESLFGS